MNLQSGYHGFGQAQIDLIWLWWFGVRPKLPQKIMLTSKDVKSYWLIIISHIELGPSLILIEPNFQKTQSRFFK